MVPSRPHLEPVQGGGGGWRGGGGGRARGGGVVSVRTLDKGLDI